MLWTSLNNQQKHPWRVIDLIRSAVHDPLNSRKVKQIRWSFLPENGWGLTSWKTFVSLLFFFSGHVCIFLFRRCTLCYNGKKSYKQLHLTFAGQWWSIASYRSYYMSIAAISVLSRILRQLFFSLLMQKMS